MNVEKNIMSIADASVYLGVSCDTIRRWEKKGYIKSFRTPGNHRRYNKEDLDKIKNE
jgi:excisionase family DNA binding protein